MYAWGKIMKNRNLFCIVMVVAFMYGLPCQLFAAPSFTGGMIEEISPPPDASWEALESSLFARFWAEKSSVVLTEPLLVDIISPKDNPEANSPNPHNSDIGFYDSGVATKEAKWNGDLAPGVYDSFFLHADKQGDNVTYSGTITFDNPIEAIIYKRPNLIATDPIFGAPGTIYDLSSTRLLELDGAVNWFSVSGDGLTLTFQTYVPHDLDNMRVITGVPEPATLCLLGIGSLGFFLRRKSM